MSIRQSLTAVMTDKRQIKNAQFQEVRCGFKNLLATFLRRKKWITLLSLFRAHSIVYTTI